MMPQHSIMFLDLVQRTVAMFMDCPIHAKRDSWVPAHNHILKFADLPQQHYVKGCVALTLSRQAGGMYFSVLPILAL